MPVIGQWARRFSPHDGHPFTLWHLVESLVAGDIITKCGKRMRDRKDQPFETDNFHPRYQWCETCHTRA